MSLLISFEGVEAVGKPTLIQEISKHLKAQNIRHITTREPGGSMFAEKVRKIAFSDHYNISASTELLLMFAARQDHLETVILPHLKENYIVLCDRFIDSSFVYQGILGGVDESVIDRLCNDFIAPYFPNMTFFITANISIIMDRLKKRKRENHYDDLEEKSLFQLQEAFIMRQKKTSNSFIIENNNAIHTSLNQITHLIDAYMAS